MKCLYLPYITLSIGESVELVRELACAFYDIVISSDYSLRGASFLHIAAFIGNIDIFMHIFEKNGLGNINPTNIVGETPLHFAARNGCLQMCQYIMDKIENKNPPSLSKISYQERKKTPLHLAAKKGHLEICKLIIENENVEDKNPHG